MTELDDDGAEEPTRPRHLGRVVGGLAAAIALLALGAAGGAYWTRSRPATTTGSASSPAVAPSQGAPGPTLTAEPMEVTLTPEAIQRAGIKIATVRMETMATSLTVPATITSNAYQETKVNALVGGVVRQVRRELGQSVHRGETLAVIFSHELADAQMKYVSMQAMLVADHQKLE